MVSQFQNVEGIEQGDQLPCPINNPLIFENSQVEVRDIGEPAAYVGRKRLRCNANVLDEPGQNLPDVILKALLVGNGHPGLCLPVLLEQVYQFLPELINMLTCPATTIRLRDMPQKLGEHLFKLWLFVANAQDQSVMLQQAQEVVVVGRFRDSVAASQVRFQNGFTVRCQYPECFLGIVYPCHQIRLLWLSSSVASTGMPSCVWMKLIMSYRNDHRPVA